MLLAVLRHVDANHRFFVVEEEVRQRLGQLRLTDAGGAEEEERACRPVLIGNTSARTAYRVGHSLHSFILTDHAMTQDFLHGQELFGFALHHLAGRDAGPCGDNFGHCLGGDFLREHGVLFGRVHGLLGRVQLLFQFRNGAIAQLCYLFVVAVALCDFRIRPGLLQLLLDTLYLGNGGLFVLPPSGQCLQVFALVSKLFFQVLKPDLRRFVGLLLQGHFLDL